MNKLFKINENDNVAVALCDLKAGFSENGITLKSDVPFGHKVLLKDVPKGGQIIKYGWPIGRALHALTAGDYVHSHNLKTDLAGAENGYEYSGGYKSPCKSPRIDRCFSGYRRENGEAGVRNELWIIPTVGCVNKLCERLKNEAVKKFGCDESEIKVFAHPYGCSQLGGDLKNTQKLLSALVNHPNAGGVLVVSLGCENNNLGEFKPFIGRYDENRVKFFVAQDVTDELSAGLELLAELEDYRKSFTQTQIPVCELKIGLKCGGSDAFSGITANALCGRVTDTLTASGCACILTETPEMFGAEKILMQRAENERVFGDTVSMINRFKEYFISNNQPVYENPSPGNKAGGITTLEEKSLGCIQKGGAAAVSRVLDYAQRAEGGGLQLLYGPGNDIVSSSALTAAGAHIILFTTGRGTPLGAPVPTLKISSNTALCERKPGWIDFDAGVLLSGASFEEAGEKLISLILDCASGRKTKNELSGVYEFAVFKNGVTM